MNTTDNIIKTHYGEAKNHGEPSGVRLTFEGFKNRVAQAAMNYPFLQRMRGQFNDDFLRRCYEKEMTPDEVCKQMIP